MRYYQILLILTVSVNCPISRILKAEGIPLQPQIDQAIQNGDVGTARRLGAAQTQIEQREEDSYRNQQAATRAARRAYLSARGLGSVLETMIQDKMNRNSESLSSDVTGSSLSPGYGDVHRDLSGIAPYDLQILNDAVNDEVPDVPVDR